RSVAGHASDIPLCGRVQQCVENRRSSRSESAAHGLLTRVRAQKRVLGEQRHVVLDGKTLRGTQHHLATDQKKMHHMNVYEAKTGIVRKRANGRPERK